MTAPLPGQLDLPNLDGATATEVERPLPGDSNATCGEIAGRINASFVSPGDHVAGNEDCEVGAGHGGAPSETLRWLPWLCFDLADDEDLAAERFVKRFGTPPRFVLEWDGLLRVGPVPEGGTR